MTLKKLAHVTSAISTLLALAAALYLDQPILYGLTVCFAVATAMLQPADLRRRAADRDHAEEMYLAAHPADKGRNESNRKLEKIGTVAIVVGGALVIILVNFVRPESGMGYPLMAAIAAVTLGVGLCLYSLFIRAQVSRRARFWNKAQD